MTSEPAGETMPRQAKMTWNRKQKRWFKKANNKQFVVSCRVLSKEFPELFVSATEEGSYRAANAWWDSRADDQQKELAKRMTSVYLESLRKSVVDRNKKSDDNRQREEAMTEIYRQAGDGEISMTAAVAMMQDLDRPSTGGTTLEQCGADFLSAKKAEVGVRIGDGRWDNLRQGVDRFVEFCGSVKVDDINGGTLSKYHQQLSERIGSRKISAWHGRNLLQVAKQLVTFAYETERLQVMPRNLHSKNLVIEVQTKEIEVFSVKEVRELLRKAKERTRLYLLLMLNTGMTQQDISDMTHRELKDGKLTRKRSKTKKHSKVPVVTYTLWDSTLKLLRKHADKRTERVLLTPAGNPLVRRELVRGKFRVDDVVAEAWSKLGARLSCKYLRKTSSSLLASRPEFASVASLFLGHAPRSIQERHYTRPATQILAEGIKWLGEQYGVQ